ncbi:MULTISPECIES: LytTR family DNA-binding domain-containing protein [unclassified Dehalobacter]|jgi:Response regulator of the LytR/AlgR family|uniref:LytR/AlgR family response regulator transcription factor n=1 Tax=unclassified Dehalobacter TaxID=2635733 RepID=UPI00028B963B|nr:MULTISPECIES: LytTR family DNA-binding domain-containing protein [unclassified Dehalobacter]AFV03671.1 Autolysis response regulater LytR [Dehalobacter sp. DCA]AFV06658.1 Response regulator of the LytR/AlgR family [Dehalobacter sp. CF]EQB20296.1 Autolysis response regulater LytR [Dehalobacter sp. UNSWDHB]MDJ0305093.1 LytTR family DNA-binding domain-containing protein [Dehalobacter sp.]
MKIRALLVDDESPARKELRYLLKSFEDVLIVGEAENALEAMELIDSVDYSVIFLDINMPGLNGIELARKLSQSPKQPAVIFTTAHEEFAFDAFSVHAYDYLLKPIHPKRLEEALNTVRKRKTPAPGQPKTEPVKEDIPEFKPLEVIAAEYNGKTILIRPEEIIYISTDKDNVYVKTEADFYLTRYTLRDLESRLDPKTFFRTHRCYLVNIKKMRELVPYFNGTYTVIVQDKDKSEVPVSRTQARRLKEILGI